ncbi:MAG: response regulator transcription factor [Burkholderiaceae bacterium]|nr:response regulator transcription factor [Burkholderiaceae bacterium]
MSPPVPLRVVLVDDHAVVREGYRRLLELDGSVEVIGEHGSADAAIDALDRGVAPDVMVVDLSMPGRSGFEVLRRAAVHTPQVPVLVFTMHETPAMLEQALRAGAHGYVTKSSEPQVLVQAVRRVAAGEQRVLSPDLEHMHAAPPAPALAPRELEVLQLLLQGNTVDEISRRMELSQKTVANYQTMIRHKLGASTGIELLRVAQRRGLAPY